MGYLVVHAIYLGMYMVWFYWVLVRTRLNPRGSLLTGLATNGFYGFHGSTDDLQCASAGTCTAPPSVRQLRPTGEVLAVDTL